jgi:type IV pilus assembly protein PilC
VADGLENPSLRDLVLDIRTDVAAGNNFAGALRSHPKHFDDLFCNLVDSGEQSGALETMLDRVASYLEKSETLKKKVKKAMTYPISVLVVAMVVTGILLLKVVPEFESLFAGFGAELPAFTQMVINLSEWMQEWWLICVAIIALIIYAFKEAKRRSPKFADQVDAYMLKMPVVGNIVEKSAIARFGRVLSTTFAAGVPLVDALNSVAGATGNAVFRDAVLKIRDDVSSGTQLQFSMKQTGVFPAMAVQMVAIGEESGALDTMLDKVATYFEEEVDNLVDNLTTMMEPIIMSVLGVLVGGLIISMYLPIFQMGQAV